MSIDSVPDSNKASADCDAKGNLKLKADLRISVASINTRRDYGSVSDCNYMCYQKSSKSSLMKGILSRSQWERQQLVSEENLEVLWGFCLINYVNDLALTDVD